MKKLKRILCAMLSVCMIMLPVSSAAVGAEDNIDDLKKKLSELEAKSAQYQAELDKTKADIKDIKTIFPFLFIPYTSVFQSHLNSRPSLKYSWPR